MSVYRPLQAQRGTTIMKLVSCEDAFAALSSNGEIFMFSAPAPEGNASSSPTERERLTKAQRVWTLGKQSDTVRVWASCH